MTSRPMGVIEFVMIKNLALKRVTMDEGGQILPITCDIMY